MIADLHAEMAGAHATSEFSTGGINILQRHLAQRAQSAFAASAQLQRGVIKKPSAFQRVLRLAIVGKKHRRRGNDLMIHAVAIHLFEAHVRIPTRRSDMAKYAIAEHDHGFAWLRVFDRRPIGRAESRRQVRP